MSDAAPEITRSSQITIDISPPVTFDNREYTQLVLREPNGNDMLAGEEQVKMGRNDWTVMNRQLHMIARCSGVPFPVVGRLPARTINKAWAFIYPFYNYGLETGEN